MKCIYLVAAYASIPLAHGESFQNHNELTDCMGGDCQMWGINANDCGLKQPSSWDVEQLLRPVVEALNNISTNVRAGG